jgi:hypothetical protein
MMYVVPEETKRRIHDLHSQGLSMRDIAVAMGWGERGKDKVCGIVWRMRRDGLDIAVRGTPIKANSITANMTLEIIKKLRANQSAASIAAEFGISVDHVKNIRSVNKLPAYKPVRKRMMAVIPTPAQNVIPFPVRPKARPTPSGACCQYPIGPRLSVMQTHIFCEDPNVVPGKPYCEEHCAMAYVTPRPREKRSQFIDWRWRVG